MKISIVNIGDELLIGQVVNTNAAWLGRFLNENGYTTNESVSVGDNADEIKHTLSRLYLSSDLILLTGGLGPTKDDITVKTLADFFQTSLIQNEELLSYLQAYYEKRQKPFDESVRKMAMVPADCTILLNTKGTAASMWFEREGKVLVSMPGVPYEMKDMMQREVMPRLREFFPAKWVYNRTLLTCGAPETALEHRIRDIQDSLEPHFKIAYLPTIGRVRVRLSAQGSQEQKVKADLLFEQIKSRLIPYVYGEGEDELEAVLGRIFIKNGLTLSLAESCTGGFLSHLITSVPGCSVYFQGAVVAYSYEVKKSILGVNSQTLTSFGAVSEETVKEMAQKVLARLHSHYAISISGIAGPGGATSDKPVGLVWIAIASKDRVKTKKLQLGTLREINIPLSAYLALNELRLFLAEDGYL